MDNTVLYLGHIPRCDVSLFPLQFLQTILTRSQGKVYDYLLPPVLIHSLYHCALTPALTQALAHGAVYCLASGLSIFLFRQKTDFLNHECPPSGAFSALSRLSRKHPAVQGDVHHLMTLTGCCHPSIFVRHCAPLPGCPTDKAPSCACLPALNLASEF